MSVPVTRIGAGRAARGWVTVYTVLVMPVLFGFMALAVDFGRVQSARFELQSIVDAAVRAAGEDLARSKSTDSAIASAIAVASQNKVDGQPFQLRSSDVEFGTWDPTTRTYQAGGDTINAVRIIGRCRADRSNAIPAIMATLNNCIGTDISATATACIVKEIATFNANGDVTFNHQGQANGGWWQTDSYIGANAPFSTDTVRGNGNLLSQGSVKYNFAIPADAGQGWSNLLSNVVMGTIYTTSGADCTYTLQNNAGGGQIVQYGGWENPGASTATPPSVTSFATPTMPARDVTPPSAATYLSGSTQGFPNLVVSNGGNVTLPGGIYNLGEISITNGSTVTFSGPVVLNVATNMTIDNSAIQTSENDARNLKINLCNTSSNNAVTINSLTQDLYADLNAPAADFAFAQSENGKALMGRVKSRNMTINSIGNGSIHGDESLLGRFYLAK